MMNIMQSENISGSDIIDTEEKLLRIIGELGAEFAENQLLRYPDLVLCFEWISNATIAWSDRLPQILRELGFECDEDGGRRAVRHFMLAAITRLDEMTGRGRSLQEARA